MAAWALFAELYAWSGVRIPILSSEDGVIEWLTVTLFAAAGIILLRRGIRERRPFDVLVAVFALFVAGEEMSWGQRLLGLTPPEFFLANNGQQELNVHNMARPRSVFSALIAAYGVLLPLAGLAARRLSWLGALLRRIGATPPALALVPWAVATVILAQWDPQKVTSEFAECLAGFLFVAATWRAGAASRWRAPRLALAAVPLLTAASTLRPEADATRLACARAETDALAADIAAGGVMPVRPRGAVDTQVWQAATRGELRVAEARRFHAAQCPAAPASGEPARRRYAVDPWGNAYWIAVRGGDAARRIVVYSLGPNRRLDGDPASGAGDDVAAVRELPRVMESAGEVAGPR